MAKCIICKTEIPDGTEYCKDCLDKEMAKTNESYLDSLLSSVKNTAPSTDLYKKKSFQSTKSSEDILNHTAEPDIASEDMFKVDLNDIKDFDQYNLEDVLSELQNDAVISDIDLFGEELSDLLNKESTIEMPASNVSDTSENVKAAVTKESQKSEESMITEEFNDEISKKDKQISEDELERGDELGTDDEYEMNTTPDLNEKIMAQPHDNREDEFEVSNDGQNSKITNIEKTGGKEDLSENRNPYNEDIEDDGLDDDLNDLLNRLDLMQNDDEFKNEENETSEINVNKKDKSASIDDPMPLDDKEPGNQEQANEEEVDDDFLSLLNQIAPEDPVAEDIRAIGDLMSGKPVEPQKKDGTPSDVGEVFSDALKVVSNLNDPNLNEAEILKNIPDNKSNKEKKKEKKGKKDKKKAKKKATGEQNSENSDGKPKKSLVKRLFGNIKDEKAKKNTPITVAADSLADGESAVTKEKKKKSKVKKGKKSAVPQQDGTDGTEETQGKGKSAKNKADKKEKKKEKKEKKQKTKEVIQVIDEIDEDEGRINRLGASIVFIFFGLLAALFYFGSNAVNYTLSIQHASAYFEDKKYTQAYNEVYGVDIKDKDIEIYEKIQTVMFVNKQLNSYNNYSALKEYPQALDSLLKGLKRYDKYIELATKLGIKTDMDYVRRQILAELKKEFNLSEKKALEINRINNMTEYSLKVYDVAGSKK